MENKMQIEVWSDVMCPFCYIGKKKFEMALAQFPNSEKVELIWKSFQLMPELQSGTAQKLENMLMQEKGLTRDQITEKNASVVHTGKKVGIDFHFDRVYAANTFHAHCLIHFAQQNNKQHAAEEVLFHSFFTEGKNIDDISVLVALGEQIGLDTHALRQVLENGSFTDAVLADLNKAQEIGLQGVPYFIFDKSEAVSGARDPAIFLDVLAETFAKWEKKNQLDLNTSDK